jgi:serine/threonine protein kinase
MGDDLGSGSFSVVKQAKKRSTGDTVAVKCISRAHLPPDEIEALRDEGEQGPPRPPHEISA